MLTWTNDDFSSAHDKDYTLRDIVEGMGYDLGLDDYPIFEESYRPKLNQAIVEHFWFREIASETPAKFVFYLNRYMREHMPTYNIIYEKLADSFTDPLATSQSTSYGDATNSSTSDNASNSSGDGKSIYSRTPQVYLQNAESEAYMDNMTHTTSSATDSATSNNSGSSDYRNRATSVDGGYSRAIYDMMASQFVETDTLVFNMLEPLFVPYPSDYPR